MSKKLRQDEFLSKSNEAHSGVYDYSEAVYTGRMKLVTIRCPLHEIVFQQSAGTHMDGKTACEQCFISRRSATRKTNRLEGVPTGFKICKKCATLKNKNDFSFQTDGTDGLRSVCKSCQSGWALSYRSDEDNHPVIKKRQVDYYQKNKDKVNKRTAEYLKNNREMANTSSKKWRDKNPSKVLAKTQKRRANKLKAVPIWVIDNEWSEFLTQEIYDISARRTTMLGIKFNVDHIVPLQSKLVCGLHCPDNLQVITFTQNMVKGNRVWPDMWT